MNLNDLQELCIVSGPTNLAYEFDEATGRLTIWLADHIEEAPETARHSKVLPGYTRFIMKNAVAVSSSGRARLEQNEAG